MLKLKASGFVPKWKIKATIQVFGLVLGLGIALVVTIGAVSINKVRIGGSTYDEIVQAKDLVADILPPPLYVIEAYLEASLAYNHAKPMLETRKNNTVVPVAAIQRGPQGTYVFALKPDKTVELRPVTVSFNEGSFSSISMGLNPGDQVITDGQDKLQNGSQVEVRGGGDGSASQSPGAGNGPGSGVPGAPVGGERKKRPDAAQPK